MLALRSALTVAGPCRIFTGLPNFDGVRQTNLLCNLLEGNCQWLEPERL
jgi:hypothetical protein